MRQAVEPSWKESLDAIEEIVGVLLRHSADEQLIQSRVASALVDALDYAAVLVAMRDEQGRLILRAYALGTPAEVGAYLARVLDDARAGEATLAPMEAAENVYELLYPLLAEGESARWQAEATVRAVCALPFSLADELSGEMLVLSYRPDFGERELRLLRAASQQLALGVRYTRLSQRLDEQQQAAETFAHMAFSGSAYVHTLRNHIGALRTYLGLVKLLPHLKPEQRNQVLASSRKAQAKLDQAAEILDHLHEPWRRQPEVDTDVNDCLAVALLKVFGSLPVHEGPHGQVTSRGVSVQWRLATDLPALHTSREMLTEAFRVIIRNASDALHEKFGEENAGGVLQVESEAHGDELMVTVRDNGPGIAPGDLRRIFEMGWSTKMGQGMGFGLFWASNFVEGLGGRIEVESVPQQGTAFRLVLPTASHFPQ